MCMHRACVHMYICIRGIYGYYIYMYMNRERGTHTYSQNYLSMSIYKYVDMQHTQHEMHTLHPGDEDR